MPLRENRDPQEKSNGSPFQNYADDRFLNYWRILVEICKNLQPWHVVEFVQVFDIRSIKTSEIFN